LVLKKIRRVISLSALALLLVAVIFAFQRAMASPDLRAVDPAKMGRSESAMWKSYYDGNYARLGWETMGLACGQYGFSWWDGGRISLYASRSAMFFRKNTDDPRCALELEKYYAIIQRAVSGKFNVREAARLELEWWKARRRKVPPQEYARTIAKLIAVTYGVPEESVLPGAMMRTEALAYRDARRDGKMTTADWDEVTRQLSVAYTSLKTSIANAL